MTAQQLKNRLRYCQELDLCFISLRPFEPGDAAVLVYHSELKARVLVHREFCPKDGVITQDVSINPEGPSLPNPTQGGDNKEVQ